MFDVHAKVSMVHFVIRVIVYANVRRAITYISSQKRVVVAQILVEETQELLKMGDKVLRDVVAVQIMVDLSQQVESLKENFELRNVLRAGINHPVRSLWLTQCTQLLATIS
jgi:hypothetical protein